MKQTITQNEYLMLHGLAALATRYNEKLVDIVAAAVEIVDEGESLGHMADMIYGEYGVDEQLAKMGITVEGRR